MRDSFPSKVMKKFEKGNSDRKRRSVNKYRRIFRGSYNYSYDELINFIEDNKRMPNSRNPNEISLYQFYYKIIKKFGVIDSMTNQEKKLVELINEHKYSKQLKVG